MIKIIGEVPSEFTAAAVETFRSLALSGECVVEVVFVDKEEILSLNSRTRNVNKVTDVLSYPMLTEIMPLTKENYPFDYDEVIGGVCLGSIVICSEVASEQAAEYGHSQEREGAYLFTHGLLHLLGYDHIEENDRRVMRDAEERILSAIGINR